MSETQTGKLIPYLTEMFRLQAWVAMGKIANPATGKVERELPLARAMIDLLVELEARTEGNRSDQETRILQGAVTELRLNYVEEAKKPEATEAEPGTEEASTPEETSAPEDTPAPEGTATESEAT